MNKQDHPHDGQPVAERGQPLDKADAVMIMLHGRGGQNDQMLSLIDHIDVTGFAYLAPQAANYTWYPYSFMMPRTRNAPYLASALMAVDALVKRAIDGGLASERIMLLGFSQGACLASEYAARYPRRFGGVVALSGGLIGADNELAGYNGTLDATPVFLGCSDVDSHIPVGRVHRSADIFAELGASVEKRIYPGMPHTVNQDELDYVKQMMRNVIK